MQHIAGPKCVCVFVLKWVCVYVWESLHISCRGAEIHFAHTCRARSVV